MSTAMVDWNVAVNTARKLVKPGPAISMEGALAAVSELRDNAGSAESYVEDVTGLRVPPATAPVLVVDRPGWIQANADAFATIMAPLNDKAAERLAGSTGGASQTMAAVGSRVSGAEVGALLSYLAPKILGQFDPFYRGAVGEPGGRLLLVAPNVVMVERELDLVPSDFRLWVCLHEETHRVQFTAVPWLRGYLNAQVAEIVDATELDPAAVLAMVKNGVSRLGEAIKHNQEVSIVDLVQTPAQRATVERITAVMSLLEGHADVVMDSVGTDVVPSVETIRARFNVRRRGQGMDRMLRKLLGLDAKMRQYRDGAAFCNRVIESVGMSGFNRVWEGPHMLPTPAEIADPALWVARVHSDSTIARHEAEHAAARPESTDQPPPGQDGGPEADEPRGGSQRDDPHRDSMTGSSEGGDPTGDSAAGNAAGSGPTAAPEARSEGATDSGAARNDVSGTPGSADSAGTGDSSPSGRTDPSEPVADETADDPGPGDEAGPADESR